LLSWYLHTLPGIEVVAEAADGVEALAEVERTNPDLVLMDVRMPNMDGLEATRRMRAAPIPPPRILLLTNHADAIPPGLRRRRGRWLLDKCDLADKLPHAMMVGRQ
jgi:CheY-like chemotaxis protein